MEDLPVFRAPKKRKLVQNRRDEEKVPTPASTDGTAADTESQFPSETANVVRVRKLNKPMRTGIVFSNKVRDHGSDEPSTALVPVDSSNDRLKDMTNRFIGSTGQVIDEDKHMYAPVKLFHLTYPDIEL